jgi:lipopolysaccharide transport system permease protein/teichoic acid transport system permease protein
MFKQLQFYITDIYLNKNIVFDLILNDLKSKYIKNIFGVFWAFFQPITTIAIFWFVFEIGFKSKPVDDFPFILWLMCGMIPWFFISESIQSGTKSIVDNSFLVKKIVFKVYFLPFIKIMSSFLLHIFFIVFLIGMFLFYGYKPSIYWLQIIYYLFFTLILLVGITLITSSVVVFFKDFENIINMIIQFSFWLTPIFWSIKILPQQYQNLMQYSPIYYIIEGFRDSFINQVWFWENMELFTFFWGMAFFCLLMGIILFNRLKVHFADVI